MATRRVFRRAGIFAALSLVFTVAWPVLEEFGLEWFMPDKTPQFSEALAHFQALLGPYEDNDCLSSGGSMNYKCRDLHEGFRDAQQDLIYERKIRNGLAFDRKYIAQNTVFFIAVLSGLVSAWILLSGFSVPGRIASGFQRTHRRLFRSQTLRIATKDIARYKELLDAGVLTQAEYEQKVQALRQNLDLDKI